MPSLFVKLPNWMGDILFAYDLLFSLSCHFDRIGLCTSIQHSDLFSIFPVPNAEVIAYPAESWPHWDPETIQKIEHFQADGGLVLPNSIGSALALRWAGVSPLYGYDYEHRGFLLRKSLKPPTHRMHQSEYFLELLKLFDIAPARYPALPNCKRESLAILHPGASKKERAWHLDRFVEIGRKLKEEGLAVMFVSGEELHLNGFSLTIKPSLGEFAELLKRCALFIGNDSGPLHLAQQCGAPVIGIYGPGDPSITGLRSLSTGRVIYHSFPCSPCRQRFFVECEPSSNQKPFCIETITVEEVWKMVKTILKDGIEYRPPETELRT
ncbi:glycosyltransferase family 9 protein [bacterium]|nr:glycosyltransferase family 9 protein [bacterium]